MGIDSTISYNLTDDEIESYDVIILGKCLFDHHKSIVDYVNLKYPNKLVGTITPSSSVRDIPFDFVMAGSLEEADSLSFHRNVILNAHIESIFLDSETKVHQNSDTLKLCVHGWSAHLASFAPNLQWALEEFEKEQDYELVIISETSNLSGWDIGKPNIKKICAKKWGIDTIRSDIQSCDIGIVPGIYDLTSTAFSDVVNNKNGFFDTDYVFRFKNKCNNGRSLAFFQLGVPVVADFSPSHFHMMGDGECGFVAHTKDGWLNSFRKLKGCSSRQIISDNARSKVELEYDPLYWADRYYQELYSLWRDKNE